MQVYLTDHYANLPDNIIRKGMCFMCGYKLASCQYVYLYMMKLMMIRSEPVCRVLHINKVYAVYVKLDFSIKVAQY